MAVEEPAARFRDVISLTPHEKAMASTRTAAIAMTT
jgi:hypothetical protein